MKRLEIPLMAGACLSVGRSGARRRLPTKKEPPVARAGRQRPAFDPLQIRIRGLGVIPTGADISISCPATA